MNDKVVFSVPWFDILARDCGEPGKPYYLLQTTDYVTVLAADTNGSLLLVRQFRPVVGADTIELPSGHVEEGETPEQAARRELAEETGYEAETFELLGSLVPDTGRLGNKLWCFFAGSAKEITAPLEREAGVSLVHCTPRDLLKQITDGTFDHALHMAVLLLAMLRGHITQ